MGVRQERILTVSRLFLVFIALLIVSLTLTGCGKCTINKEKSTVLKEIKQVAPRIETQAYTVTEKRTEKKCHTETINPEKNEEIEIPWGKFLIKLGPKEWLDTPLVEGKTNWIRREMTVYNGYDELKMVYLDKIDYYNGTEVKRSKNPMKLLVEPHSSRIVPLMKDTQYDPLVDIGADFTNNTEKTGMPKNTLLPTTKEVCEDVVKEEQVEKYRNISKGTKEVVMGYTEMLRVKLTKEC